MVILDRRACCLEFSVALPFRIGASSFGGGCLAALVLEDGSPEDFLALLDSDVVDLVVDDADWDGGAFLEKKENRFFCLGGGLVDFAMV